MGARICQNALALNLDRDPDADQCYVEAIKARAAGAAGYVEQGSQCAADEVVFSAFVFCAGGRVNPPLAGLVDNSTHPKRNYFPCAPVIVGPQDLYLFHRWGGSM